MTRMARKKSGQGKTLLGLWALPLARALDERGVDAKRMFKRALIDLEEMRGVEGAKMSSAAFDRVWDMAIDTTGDPLIGLEIVNFIHPGTFGSVGFAITASVTFADAFERLRNLQRLMSTTLDVGIERDASSITLTIGAIDPKTHPMRGLGFIAAMLKLFRDMSRLDLTPLEARLSLDIPKNDDFERHMARLERYFDCPVKLTRGHKWQLVFSAEDAFAPLPAANASLAERLDEVARQVLSEEPEASLASLATAIIIDRLPSGTPNVADVAFEMHMTPRTLQRRLMEEGGSFKDLLNRARKQLAEGYIRAGSRSQKEIAFLLGFADISHFSRAFKSWFGCPPGQMMAASRDKRVAPIGKTSH